MQFPAKILYQKKLLPSQIHLHQKTAKPLPATIAKIVNNEWGHQVVMNPKLTNDDILVANRIEIGVDDVQINCAHSNVKNVVGTTCDPDIPEENQLRALGVMCLLTTADDFLVFGIRSPSSGWGTLRHIVPACWIGIHDANPPYAALWRAAKEALGLEFSDFEETTGVGLVENLTWSKLSYEFVCSGRLKITAREVAEKAETATLANQHCQLDFFPRDKQYLERFLAIDPTSWVPTGWAGTALTLHSELNIHVLPWEPTPCTYEKYMGRRLSK